jgi:hypothetical protein
MDLLQKLNDAVAYIESCLCDEIDMDKLAQKILRNMDTCRKEIKQIAALIIGSG